MTYRHSTLSLLDLLGRSTMEIPNNKFPPYDVILVDDTNFKIRIATAGFSKEELSIDFISDPSNQIVISGNKESPDTSDRWVRKGIAARNFHLKFALERYVEPERVSYVDGILEISLKKIVPEEKQPKKLQIT